MLRRMLARMDDGAHRPRTSAACTRRSSSSVSRACVFVALGSCTSATARYPSTQMASDSSNGGMPHRPLPRRNEKVVKARWRVSRSALALFHGDVRASDHARIALLLAPQELAHLRGRARYRVEAGGEQTVLQVLRAHRL